MNVLSIDNTNKNSLNRIAIFTGISVLIMSVAAIIATEITIGKLFVENSPTKTLQNILSNELQFRIGTLSWIIILIYDLFVSWGLYLLLKPVNQIISLLMGWLRLVYSALLGAAIVNLINIIGVISIPNSVNFLGDQLFQNEVFLNILKFYNAWSFALIIFGLHLIFLGYLVFKSGYIPKCFGILLILASIGYLITNLLNFMIADYDKYKSIIEMIFIIPMLSEIAFGFWLVYWGIKKRGVNEIY